MQQNYLNQHRVIPANLSSPAHLMQSWYPYRMSKNQVATSASISTKQPAAPDYTSSNRLLYVEVCWGMLQILADVRKAWPAPRFERGPRLPNSCTANYSFIWCQEHIVRGQCITIKQQTCSHLGGSVASSLNRYEQSDSCLMKWYLLKNEVINCNCVSPIKKEFASSWLLAHSSQHVHYGNVSSKKKLWQWNQEHATSNDLGDSMTRQIRSYVHTPIP